jgi:tetratricopeptide (TPR) repeat protein
MLGFALFHLGKYENAKKYLLEYLEANPKDFDTILYLGELYFFL